MRVWVDLYRWARRGTAWCELRALSEHATRVELCLSTRPRPRAKRSRSRSPNTLTWSGTATCQTCGRDSYGYRARAARPGQGHRSIPTRSSWTRRPRGGRTLRWDASLFGFREGQDDLTFDDRDSAAHAPLAAVVDPAFTWGDDRPLRTPWHETLIYELHVKGFTAQHPSIPETLRGTYLGLATEPAIHHLVSLGVTAVELMPVHHHTDEWHLVQRGLRNYWGYNTLSYFAPDARYAASASPLESVREFKMMVRALHAAGLEVILDVVYNHTAEGNHLGPTVSLRGIDNRTYYRLQPHPPRYYEDFTGRGHNRDMREPACAAADHGQPALLGDRDARGRVPVRPGERAGS
jgi:glycogen operon protein